MKKYFITLTLIGLNFLVAYSAMAQGFLNSNNNPAPGLFVGPGHFGGSGTGTVQDILLYILQIGLSLAGVFAVLFLILGGYYYVVSGDNEKLTEKGKKYMTNSLIGFAIIVMSWVILTVVQNAIVNGTT